MTTRRGYTLIEVLIVVTVLGIAASMVVPAFSQTNTLRLQGAVRSIVADITQAQSDAVAMQIGQGLTFFADAENSRYLIAPVSGTSLDTASDIVVNRRIGGAEFGHATFANITFPSNTLVFDAMGGPVASAGSDTPAATGRIDIVTATQTYRIVVEAYTGRVTVQSIELSSETLP